MTPRGNHSRDAVIAGAVRSPIGRRNGALSALHPVDLVAQILNALVHRTGVDPAAVDDVILGCVSQAGEQSTNIARSAVLAAGWPETIPGTTVDRQCGSAQQAIHFAAAGVIAGHYDVAVAGGVESMSRVPMFSGRANGPGTPLSPALAARYGETLVDQGISAELIAARWGITRDQADRFSLRSHRLAAEAAAAGRTGAEITPVTVPGPGGASIVTADGGIRTDSSPAGLAGLRPVFQDDGIVTAGNSSQISDGAAALLVTTSAVARRMGLRPLARVHSCAVVGVDPVTMLTGPIPATRKALDLAGLSLDEIDVFEINEAFATVPLAWLAETGADPERLNPDGGAIALGHPLGATGARLMTSMVHHMAARGLRYGLQAVCEYAGMANATVIELL